MHSVLYECGLVRLCRIHDMSPHTLKQHIMMRNAALPCRRSVRLGSGTLQTPTVAPIALSDLL